MGVFVRIAALIVLIPTLIAFCDVTSALAQGKHKPVHKPASTSAVQSAPARTVAYEPDGTPIATGEPRRLSPLASPRHSLALNRPAPPRKPAHPPQQQVR